MSTIRTLVLTLLLAFGAGSALADGDRAQKRADAEARRAKLLERYRSLDPEKRKQLKAVFRERVKKLSAQDRKRLRKLANGRLRNERKRKHSDAKRRFMRRLVGKLSKTERTKLANLEPDERREALRGLLGKHRQHVAQRTFRLLPPEVRKTLRDELKGMDQGARFRRVRSLANEHMRTKVRELIASEGSLESKQAQLAELLKAMPKPMRERMKQQIERGFRGQDGKRRRAGQGPGGKRPTRNGERNQRR